jgi:hypothetical protein
MKIGWSGSILEYIYILSITIKYNCIITLNIQSQELKGKKKACNWIHEHNKLKIYTWITNKKNKTHTKCINRKLTDKTTKLMRYKNTKRLYFFTLNIKNNKYLINFS